METCQPVEMQTTLDAEQRLFDDTTTWLAEALDGAMRTKFTYTFSGEDLYAQDGGALKPIFLNALMEAEQLAQTSPNTAFELRRRYHEMNEYEEMLAMARGELPNTMVVVSDFPAELMDSPIDVGGYNARRKQTMLRIITRDTEGQLEVTTQSLDGSDRVALEELYHELNVCPQETELLGQRMHLNLDEETQSVLTDHLTEVYDQSLAARYEGEWFAGRQSGTIRDDNTYQFVLAQRDLLAACTGGLQSHLYELAAALQARYQGDIFSNHGLPLPELTDVERALKEMSAAGRAAKLGGVTFSGCGMSLGGGGADSLADQLEMQGYGNKIDDKEGGYSFNKYMHCVVCQAPPKKDESKKMCGPCGICRACDIKLK